MPTYLNPRLTIARAGPVLEQQFRQRYGDEEYERLYRTLDLDMQELSTDQQQQVFAIITLIGGKATEQTSIFLAIIWLSKKKMTDPIAQDMLDVARQKTVAQLIREARKAVQESSS